MSKQYSNGDICFESEESLRATHKNKRDTIITKIATEMESWGKVVYPKPGKVFLDTVRRWARQLRAFELKETTVLKTKKVKQT